MAPQSLLFISQTTPNFWQCFCLHSFWRLPRSKQDVPSSTTVFVDYFLEFLWHFPGQFCGESMPKEASKEEFNIRSTLYKVYSVSALDKAKDISTSTKDKYFAWRTRFRGLSFLDVPEVDLDVPVSAGQVGDPAHMQWNVVSCFCHSAISTIDAHYHYALFGGLREVFVPFLYWRLKAGNSLTIARTWAIKPASVSLR